MKTEKIDNKECCSTSGIKKSESLLGFFVKSLQRFFSKIDNRKKIAVKGCWNECPFYTTAGNIMECGHPYFEKQDPYDRMIITHENSKNGNIPKECPLRKKETKLVEIVRLGNIL